MSRILAFDLSKVCTGWCFLNGDKYEAGIIKLKYDTKDPNHMSDYLTRFDDTIEKLIRDFNPDRICAEGMIGGQNARTIQNISMLVGILILNAYKWNKIILETKLPSQLRKPYELNNSGKRFEASSAYDPVIHIKTFNKKTKKFKKSNKYKTAYKNFTKQLVIDYVNERYGTLFTIKDNDMTDAILAATYFHDKEDSKGQIGLFEGEE